VFFFFLFGDFFYKVCSAKGYYTEGNGEGSQELLCQRLLSNQTLCCVEEVDG